MNCFQEIPHSVLDIYVDVKTNCKWHKQEVRDIVVDTHILSRSELTRYRHVYENIIGITWRKNHFGYKITKL